jgi:hypothetical protein
MIPDQIKTAKNIISQMALGNMAKLLKSAGLKATI